jgi:hypothetical protein
MAWIEQRKTWFIRESHTLWSELEQESIYNNNNVNEFSLLRHYFRVLLIFSSVYLNDNGHMIAGPHCERGGNLPHESPKV